MRNFIRLVRIKFIRKLFATIYYTLSAIYYKLYVNKKNYLDGFFYMPRHGFADAVSRGWLRQEFFAYAYSGFNRKLASGHGKRIFYRRHNADIEFFAYRHAAAYAPHRDYDDV